ncbi:hypothetical protein BJ970_004141 [Saccharopolyspora phatthalungensis]|uniref:Uncharacterized protein n=2 Tax=Saccharopolyspora phatthalungensis TaxID=664693 RepID=A0A840Q9J0_9PSEU|nr:hypothetical protein [Saccharopolyspora phatthalungensis]
MVDAYGNPTAHRRRLERKGFTRESHAAGQSQKEARGHGNTPERPDQARRDPERYKKYLQARRTLRVVTTEGIVTVSGLRKKDRSTVARHWNAIGRYLDSGKTDSLSKFDGKMIGGYKKDGEDVPKYELETRLDPLDDYENTNHINVDSIYEKDD